jgi:hypothetical protein
VTGTSTKTIREEKEFILQAQAEKEKLLDKDWRDGMWFAGWGGVMVEWLRRCEDYFEEREVFGGSGMSPSAGMGGMSISEKGKDLKHGK